MIGEKELGNCKDTTAGVQATTKAYNICDDVDDSASRTHDVIVATLILPTGTGHLAAPTLTKGTGSAALSTVTKSAAPASTTATASPSATTTTSSSSLTSTTSPESSSASTESSSAQTSTLSTRPSSVPSMEPTASSTTTPVTSGAPGTPGTSAPAGAPAEKESPQLTSAQVAGITIGCVAVVALGAGLVLLAKCVRRKRMGSGDPEKGFNKMRDSFKSFGRRSITGPDLLGISYPIQRIPSQQGTPTFRPTKAPRADGVGLATLPGSASASNSPRPTVTRATAGAAPILPMPALPPAMVITPASRTQDPLGKKETPKPNLTLAIPKNPPMSAVVPPAVPRAAPATAPNAAPLTGRDSVITEFAEDGEGDYRSGTAIWRPPPSDPQSATTYYFADKKGNWVLRHSTVGAGTKTQAPPYPASSVELPGPQDKTKAERAYMPYTPGMVVPALRVPSREREQGAFVESPVAMRDDAHPRGNVASSIYSDYNTPLTVVPGPENPMPAVPSAVLSENNTGRNLTGTKIKRKSVKRTSRQRRMSQDSATEIESGDEEEDSQDLSPVAESPCSPSPLSRGKSPVSYPKIHKQGENVNEGLQQLRDAQEALRGAGGSTGPEPPRRNSKRMSTQRGQGQAQGQGRFPIRIVTPEERDNEGMRIGAVPHGTPRLTVGMSKPMNAPVVNPNRNKNPGQMRTGSPEGRFPIAVPVEHQQRQQHQQSQRRQSSIATGPNGYWNQQQQSQGQGEGSAYYYRAPSPRQWEQQQRQLQQAQRAQQQQQQQQQQSSYYRPSQGHYDAQMLQQQRQYRPQQPHMPQQSWPIFAQPAQPEHQSQHQHTRTNSSSLLTKRLGAEKAAALALNPNPNSSSNKSIGRPAKGWARDGQQQQQQQQQQQTGPQQARQQQQQHWQEGQALKGGKNNSQDPYGDKTNTNEWYVDLPPPPITPGWVPELTPTRRGDDLFLNVQ
ncbi:hypothetical protein NEUTE1DRAFT_144256 [Neurospora tetrasperma FGSC 2508]|uniref:Uncharacterized protein n=1 Tax=Neurospora tetrasperma (strain FGSC 2508 / ATCC MYA-4615 / P0657) TaxID=510951 RepID=F8MF70_NEUT8|nr:uncharacterized protein NEUTE1DRAFT_144256 [Neurospora tetrasperma FGSC 2508]EGO60924.1 hypothetical protein NEUTE1DRAFT_144256 [Neurospora tetrasperma FGSC 2508]